MKSKISCWRLVRSMSVRLPVRLDSALRRTCVRNVAPSVDGCKRGADRTLTAGSDRRMRGYTRALCARGGIGRRARLRALWGDFPVMVRVHSSALVVAGNGGHSGRQAARAFQQASLGNAVQQVGLLHERDDPDGVQTA